MTIAAVGFVPVAPLLVPELAGGSAPADEELRRACLDVGRTLTAARPDLVQVMVPGDSGRWPGSATWDFHGFGVPRRHPTGSVILPWQLGVGAWLLDQVGWSGQRCYLSVGTGDVAADPAVVLDGERRVAVLALADGSACRSDRAPGHLDDRAADFDASVAAALGAGDRAALASVDGTLAKQLMCPGVPVWRAVAEMTAERRITAELLAATAPYGVGYFVARWSLG